MARFAALAGVVCLLATGIWAQQLSNITGTVTDPAGAAIPGANIEIKNTDTGFLYKSGASATGNYSVGVTVGTYDVTVTASGFKKFVRAAVEVPAATDVRVDAQLQVGTLTETVTVAADVPILKTESAEVSYNVNVNTLDNLPVMFVGSSTSTSGTVRSPYTTLSLIPGAEFNNNNDFRVNGLPSNTESVLVDGQDATNTQWQQQMSQMQMSVDAIQEIALQTSNYAPEFGQAGGGVVNITMKSGTNSLHGTAYDYMTNEDFNAGEPYTSSAGSNPPTGHARPRNRLNDYGFTVGGPVDIPKIYNGHDRTFFFFNWEQLRNKQFTTTTYDTVPNAGLQAGNFALANQDLTVGSCTANCQLITTDPTGQKIYLGEIFDPASEYMDGPYRIRTPFPNNIVPANRFDPVAAKIQAMMPQPNEATYGGVYLNYLAPPYENTPHTTLPSFKIDHSFSSTKKLSIFYALNKQTSQNNNGIPTAAFNGVEPTNQRTHTIRFNFDDTLRPTLLLHIGVGDQHTVFVEQPVSYNAATQLGLNGLNSNYFPYDGSPLGAAGTLGPESLSGYSPLFGSGLMLYLTDEKPTANTYLTWVKGNHTYKFGGDMVVNSFPGVSSEYTNCWCDFSGNTTNAPYVNVNDLTAPFQAGSGYASFLLGAVNGGTFAPPADAHIGQHAFDFYVQDTWKVTRKLTLTYGVRWDYQTYLQEEHGRLPDFQPDVLNTTVGRPGGAAFEGYGGPHCNCEYSGIYPFALGPRLGAAYQITPKTVLRAGGAISYGKTAENADFSYSITDPLIFSTPNIDDADFTLSQGIPASFHTTFPNFNPGQLSTLGSLSDPFFTIGTGAGRPPRIFQWSIGLQREITNNIIVEANYVGNRSAWDQAIPPENLLAFSTLSKYGLSLAGNGATLLPEPLSSPAVQAAGFGLPYAGFPTSASLAQSLLPYPQFDAGLGPEWAPLGSTWYEALQARVTKRFSHGLELSALYTFSKAEAIGAGSSEALDQGFVAGGAASQPYGDPYNYKLDKYLSADDYPDELTITGSYTTPRVGFNKVANQLLHNWRVAAVMRYQNGQLITIPGTNNGLSSELPYVTTYATMVPGAPLFTSNPNCHCFNAQEQLALNPAAWVQTPVGQFSPTTPYLNNYRWMREPAENMSFGRIFAFGREGRYNFEFRAEFQNVFNRHFYSLPTGTSLTTPTTYGNGVLTGGYGYIAPGTPADYGAQPRSGQLVGRFRF
jgi:hypothetical protein